MRTSRGIAASVAFVLGVGIVPAHATEGSRFRRAAATEQGVVVTESLPAARVGVSVLNSGGNAIDAAVATVFAIGVSRPYSCGIGGGGFLVYRSSRGAIATLDFREEAPSAFFPRVFEGPGIYEDFSGHRTVGVPGVVDGMWEALRRYGTLPWSRLMRPARRLARRGVPVTPQTALTMSEEEDRIELFPEAARIYLENGDPFEPGDTLLMEDYARSLERIRRRGPQAFYRGRIARLIVRDMRRSGDLPGDRGLMRLRDLARYDAKWRKPLTERYRGHRVITMPPPTSGGIAVIEMLNILRGFDMASLGHSSADHFHLTAEAQKIAWADRNQYVADPDLVNVPTGALTSRSYAARRRSEIQRGRAKKYEPGDFSTAARASGDDEGAGTTTHVSVIDRWGNAVAVTCTIEQSFGSGVVAPGTGFLLNNELTDFDDPGTANEPDANKRPRSSMSPTVVARRGRPVLVTGGAGGSLIPMGVLHEIVNYVDFGMNRAHAIDAERHDAQLALDLPGFPLLLEDGRVEGFVEGELERRGHEIVTFEDIYPMDELDYATLPRLQAAGMSLKSGLTYGVTDPRTEWGTRVQR